jgi:predicted RNase H-like nuclease (RuvC/YqgF family)
MELAATDRKIVDFLRLKLVEKERSIFQLQKELSAKDEKLHEMERSLRESKKGPTSVDFRIWKSTSQLVVLSLLERIRLVTDAYDKLLDLNRKCSSQAPRALLRNVNPLPTETDRLLASTLIECARYRHEVNELRARSESLSQQMSLVSHSVQQHQQPVASSDAAQAVRQAESTIHHLTSLQRKLVREKDALALEVAALRRSQPRSADQVDIERLVQTPIAFRLPLNKYAAGF